jgi:lysyl endopeptidase
MRHARRFAALGLIACFPVAGLAAGDSNRARHAEGEPALSLAEAPASWRVPPWSVSKAARITSPAPHPGELQALHLRNADSAAKRVQIGLVRELASGGHAMGALIPHWTRVGGGDLVAQVEVRSVGAAALRVGLDVDTLDPAIELRFGGSRSPERPQAITTAGAAQRLLGDDDLYWSASTDGDAQRIELLVPAGAAVPELLSLQRLSHEVVDSQTLYRVPQKIGDSGACNVDIVCRLAELGPNFANVRHAVAHMRFVLGGSTFICTGTLLADNDPDSQVALFHSANHCFSDNTSVPPVSAQMQAVANTLNTFWNYEATTCNGSVSAPQTQLTGGAAYLGSDHITDGMLIRLNQAAPASAFFAGWNAEPLPANTAVTAIHHPRGDARMVSTGNKLSQDDFNHEVGWLSGTTEGGSSGSGLFTIAAGGAYELRGGLYGGAASCANTGNLANPDNRDYYSRLDQDFTWMRIWLAPLPEVFRNGFELATAANASP